MQDNTIKHLEFIQNIITRMNTNSFQIKGWLITIVSAVLALYAATKNYHFVLVGIFPSVVFWILDASYIQKERKFRGLYNDIVLSKNPNKLTPFLLKINFYKKGQYSYWQAFFSGTTCKLYPLIIAMLVCLYFYFRN